NNPGPARTDINSSLGNSLFRPTVCLGVTYVVVYTYGHNDGKNGLPRCAVIDVALGDRCRPRRACGKPPAGADSVRSALAAASRPVSPADPGGSRRSRTTPRSTITPYGDASLARCAPDIHPCPPRLCLV